MESLTQTVELWAANPGAWADDDPQLLEEFSVFGGSSEEQRLGEIKLPGRRKEFLVSHLLLARALDSRGFQASEVRRDSQGKPCVSSGLSFSWSYSDELIVCGIATSPHLGVDVESVQRHIEIEAVVQRYFTDKEQQQVRSVPESQAKEVFFSIWTLKEAFLKGIGTGLRTSVLDCAFMLEADGRLRFELAPGVPHNERDWQLALLEYGPHRMGVALHSAKPTLPAFDFRLISPGGTSPGTALIPLYTSWLRP